MSNRVPTVNDLRVKLCYICREEEHFDAEPESVPKKWTHPCKCTLVAHESCLLQWIQTSQGDPSRASNALKCPQCGARYELQSDRPILLRILGSGNKLLQKVGRLFTLASAVGVVAVFASGVYILLTGYGVWAVKQFIGQEMFDIILTEDPANWPWTAYFNLPSLTLSLILSRFQSSHQIPTLIPVLLVWPPTSPVGARTRILDEYWPHSSDVKGSTISSVTMWPPSPVAFGFFIVPFVRVMYRRCFNRLQYWALGASPSLRRTNGLNWQINEGGPFVIRIQANVVEGQDGRQQAPQQPPANPPADPGPDAAAVAAAEQLIEVDTSSLGRRIGGALLIPAISSMMGSFLFRLSKRSRLLRHFLGIRPPLDGFLPPVLGSFIRARDWENLGFVKQLGLTLRVMMNATWNGSQTWARADPVWWRNSLGLGIFIVAKDCLQLLHLWLAKRELESRRVKSRDFEGVDIKELDLIPSFVRHL